MYLFWLEISGEKWQKFSFLHRLDSLRLGVAMLRLGVPKNPILFSLFC